MSQLHDITYDRKYKHLREDDRYKIEGYLKAGMKPIQIAGLVGKSVRTVQREIRRGEAVRRRQNPYASRNPDVPDYLDELVYLADHAQAKYREAGKRKGAKRKLPSCPKTMRLIERLIARKRWSPDAAVGRLRLKGRNTVCTKTVYNAIDAGIFPGLTNKSLWEKKKRKKREYKKTRRVALNNVKGARIDERPKEAENRLEHGHWEMDLVVSGTGKGKAALLTLTERKSREEIILKIKDKSQKSVKEALDGIERGMGRKAFRKRFKTVTADNGSEFLDSEALEKSVCRGRPGKRTKIYYAHPYSSWERGSNECQNRMVRRFVAKGSDIRRVPLAVIARVQSWMNSYPRRILGYRTPSEAAAEEI